MPVQMSTRL